MAVTIFWKTKVYADLNIARGLVDKPNLYPALDHIADIMRLFPFPGNVHGALRRTLLYQDDVQDVANPVILILNAMSTLGRQVRQDYCFPALGRTELSIQHDRRVTETSIALVALVGLYQAVLSQMASLVNGRPKHDGAIPLHKDTVIRLLRALGAAFKGRDISGFVAEYLAEVVVLLFHSTCSDATFVHIVFASPDV